MMKRIFEERRTEKRWGRGFSLVLVLGSAVALASGCGSDDDDGGGSSGAAQAALSSCNNLCSAQAAGNCLFIVTEADCQEICDLVVTNSQPDCQQKIGANSDCQLAQSNVCDTTAVESACQMQIDQSNMCLGATDDGNMSSGGSGGSSTNMGGSSSGGSSTGGSSTGGATTGGTSGGGCDDSCIFANDAECDAPPFCDVGTDCSDCGGR
jgi:hypothetical protein